MTAALAAAMPVGPLGDALTGLVRVALATRAFGWPLGLALVVVGLAALVASDRLRRPAAAVGGAAVGVLAALAARRLLGPQLELSAVASAGLGAAVLGVACAAMPPLFPAAAGALAGALAGVHLPIGGRAAVGAGLGALAAALLALAASRAVAVVLCALSGGLALGVGLLAAAGPRPLASELAIRPFALLGFAVVAGVAGAAFQLARGAAAARPGPGALRD
ncbi:membrane protein [Anaeromyxobacter dehalogenans 2CP-1]|uniref:Membrane protein n=1 Tax=Anaeromyxobacter dehalogenans (strain ATCC BAA-258 / DSM 21875 / 2CP-1) TaxID=455488 RepID=B8JE08_ANAD2|nr:hypothetical protein [Anaeromyxobacter dehalogenans]ACL66073.1 membrane protein [Anaeromyxobacter dehalogenans 2CP-1]